MLHDGTADQDTGEHDYEERNRPHLISRLQKQAAHFGFHLTPDTPFLRAPMKLAILLVLSVVAPIAMSAQEPKTFISEPFSLKLNAPLTWRFVPAEFPTADYTIHNKDLLGLVRAQKKVPIVRVVKPVEGNRTISPAIQVFVEPADSTTPKTFLSEAAEAAAAGFRDFRITEGPVETKLNGMKAAAIACTFTADYPGDRHFPTLTRIWAIPRDEMMFVFAISGQPDDLKTLARDIDLILKSIQYTNE